MPVAIEWRGRYIHSIEGHVSYQANGVEVFKYKSLLLNLFNSFYDRMMHYGALVDNILIQ